MTAAPHAFPLEPTPIQVSDQVLDDLRARLARTRAPLDEGNEDGSYGVPAGCLRELVAHWRDGYDWRAAEAAINAHTGPSPTTSPPTSAPASSSRTAAGLRTSPCTCSTAPPWPAG